MKRKNPARVIIVFVVLAIAVVGLFFYISNRSKMIDEGKQQQMSVVSQILSRNLTARSRNASTVKNTRMRNLLSLPLCREGFLTTNWLLIRQMNSI